MSLKIYAEIRKVIGNKRVTPHYIQSRLKRLYSDATITRRLREMGCKSHKPVNRKISTAWTYSV